MVFQFSRLCLTIRPVPSVFEPNIPLSSLIRPKILPFLSKVPAGMVILVFTANAPSVVIKPFWFSQNMSPRMVGPSTVAQSSLLSSSLYGSFFICVKSFKCPLLRFEQMGVVNYLRPQNFVQLSPTFIAWLRSQVLILLTKMVVVNISSIVSPQSQTPSCLVLAAPSRSGALQPHMLPSLITFVPVVNMMD